MNFFKQDSLILLKRQGFEVFVRGKTPIAFAFPQDLVSAEEIKDKEKLKIQVADFLKNNQLTRLKSSIILAEELIFQKSLEALEIVNSNIVKEKFINEIPFPNEKILAQVYPDKKLILAVNGELFKLIIEEIEKTGGKINFVCPQTLLEATTIDDKNFSQVLSNKKLLEEINFLDTYNHKKTVNIKLPLIFVLIFLLVGGGLYFFKTQKKSVETKQDVLIVEPTPSASVSATIKQKIKKDLTVKILNGTGAPGDAGLVKKALEALDYQNIETGNLERQNATASAVIYTAEVDSYVPEVVKALKEIFKLEPLSTSTTSALFDLQIITGK